MGKDPDLNIKINIPLCLRLRKASRFHKPLASADSGWSQSQAIHHIPIYSHCITSYVSGSVLRKKSSKSRARSRKGRWFIQLVAAARAGITSFNHPRGLGQPRVESRRESQQLCLHIFRDQFHQDCLGMRAQECPSGNLPHDNYLIQVFSTLIKQNKIISN